MPEPQARAACQPAGLSDRNKGEAGGWRAGSARWPPSRSVQVPGLPAEQRADRGAARSGHSGSPEGGGGGGGTEGWEALSAAAAELPPPGPPGRSRPRASRCSLAVAARNVGWGDSVQTPRGTASVLRHVQQAAQAPQFSPSVRGPGMDRLLPGSAPTSHPFL